MFADGGPAGLGDVGERGLHSMLSASSGVRISSKSDMSDRDRSSIFRLQAMASCTLVDTLRFVVLMLAQQDSELAMMSAARSQCRPLFRELPGWNRKLSRARLSGRR